MDKNKKVLPTLMDTLDILVEFVISASKPKASMQQVESLAESIDAVTEYTQLFERPQELDREKIKNQMKDCIYFACGFIERASKDSATPEEIKALPSVARATLRMYYDAKF